METWEVLEKALGRIAREEDWAPFEAMPTVTGRHVPLCAFGALTAVAPGRASDDAWLTLVRLLPGFSLARIADEHERLSDFNDTHSHAEVCDLFRRAIAKAKADAGIYLEVPAKERVEA